VRYAFDGTDYELDLSAKNAAAFGKRPGAAADHQDGAHPVIVTE
jgi:hypothetical protein